MDVGSYGKNSDEGILSHLKIEKGFDQNIPDVSEKEALPDTKNKVSYVVIGDEAFLLKTYLLMAVKGLKYKSTHLFSWRDLLRHVGGTSQSVCQQRLVVPESPCEVGWYRSPHRDVGPGEDLGLPRCQVFDPPTSALD